MEFSESMHDEPSTSNNITDINAAIVPCNISHPWPYLKDMFEMVGTKNESYRMRCLLCQPKYHEILAFKNSSSNLKKHIERKHVNYIQEYKKLTGASIKRRSCSDDGPTCLKQLKFGETKKVSQKSVEDAVMCFVIQDLLPFSIVEQPGFNNLLLHLQPDATAMSRGSLKCKVDTATLEMKSNLKKAMSEVECIATTTDCWTAYGRSFVGVTAHWINPDTLERCSAALACKQLKGSHTFTALAGALNDIHTEYNVREKIIRTTTDNGSNFIKALRLFGDTDGDSNAEQLEEVLDTDGETSGEEEGHSGVDVKFVEVGDILEEDDGMQFILPKHHRCACHLLNLVSTVDVSAAHTQAAYRKISRSAFTKCWALWNRSARSSQATEIVEAQCKMELLRPKDTRWNSLFLAVERILKITRERGENAVGAVCNSLEVPMFTPAELAFLAEYVKTMNPIAKAINVLKAEDNVQMGWLVPTITLLKNKLDHLRLSCKFCLPLVDALQTGIEKRFGQMLTDPELIAAAILLPKFRTCWTNDDDIHKLGFDYIRRHLKEQPIQCTHDINNSSEEEDFFYSIKQIRCQESAKQLETYLASPDNTMEALKYFPSVCKLSLKLNTPLPASAACERLFSTEGLIFIPKRARLNSKNFENQLLLRLNRRFWSNS